MVINQSLVMQSLLNYGYFLCHALFCLYLDLKLMSYEEDGLKCLIFMLKTVIMHKVEQSPSLPFDHYFYFFLGGGWRVIRYVETSRVGALILQFRRDKRETMMIMNCPKHNDRIIRHTYTNYWPFKSTSAHFLTTPFTCGLWAKASLLPAQRSESRGNPGEEESPLLHPRLLSSFSPDYICLNHAFLTRLKIKCAKNNDRKSNSFTILPFSLPKCFSKGFLMTCSSRYKGRAF